MAQGWRRLCARRRPHQPNRGQAIVNEAVTRLRDPGFVNETGEPLSLGIITMNAEQIKLVENLLDKACRAHPEIEPHFDEESRLEPVCVRNLETAQGDECHLILLGIGFGPRPGAGQGADRRGGRVPALAHLERQGQECPPQHRPDPQGHACLQERTRPSQDWRTIAQAVAGVA
jgi:hypothetical protein